MSASPAQRWQAAEATLGRPRAVERAAARLPERRGWLLRAMAALDDGRRAAISELAGQAQAAGHGDIAAILEVVLADPDRLDPSELRRDAKRAGLGQHLELPFLDLLRLLAARRAGQRTTKSSALRDLEPGRPGLRAVNFGLATTSDKNYYWAAVRPLSPRLEQVLVALRGLDVHGRLRPGFISTAFKRDLLNLSADRWPDLDQAAPEIEAWLRGRRAWQHVDTPRGLSDAARRRLLGRLLIRIHQQASAGKLQGLEGPAELACELKHGLPDPTGAGVLIHALHTKLSWLLDPSEAEPPFDLLVALARADRSPQTLASVGAEAAKYDDPPEALLEPLLYHIARSADIEAASSLIEELSWMDRSAAELRAILSTAGADPWRQGWLVAVLELERGHPERSLRALPELAVGAPDISLLTAMLLRVLAEIPAGRLRTRDVQATLTAMATHHPMELDDWGPLLGLGLGGVSWPEPALASLRRLLAQSAVGLTPSELSSMIQGAEVLGDRARLDQVVKELGRHWVRLRPPELVDAAGLELMAYLWVSGSCPEGLEPLERFLLRRGPEALAKAIGSIGSKAPMMGLAKWWAAHPELGPAPSALQGRAAGDLLDAMAMTAGLSDDHWDVLNELRGQLARGGKGMSDELLDELFGHLRGSGTLPF